VVCLSLVAGVVDELGDDREYGWGCSVWWACSKFASNLGSSQGSEVRAVGEDE